MKLLATLKDDSCLNEILKLNVDGIIINGERCSSFPFSGSWPVTNKEIWVRLDLLYAENELTEVKEYLKTLETKQVSGVMITDLGLLQLVKSMSLKLKVMYDPITLLTNQYDVAELINCGVDDPVISNQIPFKDIVGIAEKYPQCFIRIHGPMQLAYSLRHYLSAYLQENKDFSADYEIVEETRENHMTLRQGTNGSWLYGDTLCSINELEQLKNDNLMIDNAYLEEKDNYQIIKMYCDLAEGKIQKKEAFEILNHLSKKGKYLSISQLSKTSLDKEAK